MRKKLFFCLIGISGYLLSCEKADSIPVEYPESQIVARTRINILAGGQLRIPILSEGDFGLSSADNNIAFALFDDNGKTIVITSFTIGETSIRIQDMNDYERYVDISVNSHGLTGRYHDKPIPGFDPLKYFILFSPDHNEGLQDENLIETIKSELYQFASERYLATYDFDYDNETVEIGFKDGRQFSGTFTWDHVTGLLLITFDNKTEKYYTYPGNSYSLCVCQDFSEYYKERYPDSGLLSVELERYLTRIVMGIS